MSSDKQRESFIVDNEDLNEDLQELKAKLAEFNIFEAIGVVRQEIRHSNFLAFLLDPSQNHRLDDIFLKQFLKQVLLETDNPTDPINHADIDITDLRDAEVSREKHYIDILIHSRQNKLVCVIENKIHSGERPNQLKKYEETINRHYKDCQAIFIYLNPEGSPPSETNWRIYDYYKVVEIIDSICINDKSTLGADIYTLMTHYSTLIRRHIVSDSEIAELCRKIYFKHKQALDLIIEHRPDLQSQIDENIRELLYQGIDSREIFITYKAKGHTDFCLKHWKTSESKDKKLLKYSIYFKFANQEKPFSDGLGIIMQIRPNGNQKIREAIFNLAKENPKIFKGAKKTKLTPEHTTIYKSKAILTKTDYEDGDIKEIMKKIQYFWEDFLKDDFVDIDQIISTNIEMILNDN